MVKYLYLQSQKENKMAGRPKIYDEEAVLDKAIGVFWEKGYENASADDLLKAMGIGKGSFYFAFKGGKQELFEKSMKRVADQYFRDFRKAVMSCENPVQLIREFFFSLAGAESLVGERGCYFGNALVQISESDAGLKTVAAESLGLLETIFQEAMVRGKELGLLKSSYEPALLAIYLINLWNGFNVTKRMVTDPEKRLALMKMNLEPIQ